MMHSWKPRPKVSALARDAMRATATLSTGSLRWMVRFHGPKRAIPGDFERDHRSRIPDAGLRGAMGLWASSATP
jgi:hypothetical protein